MPFPSPPRINFNINSKPISDKTQSNQKKTRSVSFEDCKKFFEVEKKFGNEDDVEQNTDLSVNFEAVASNFSSEDNKLVRKNLFNTEFCNEGEEHDDDDKYDVFIFDGCCFCDFLDENIYIFSSRYEAGVK